MSRSALYSPHVSGLGNSAAYQVSGKPYLTGSVIKEENNKGYANSKEYKVTFPNVTKKVTIINNSTGSNIAVYFNPKSESPSQITAVNYVVIPGSIATSVTGSFTMEIKCKELYISVGPFGAISAQQTGEIGGAAESFGVVAELTGIPATEMYELSGSGINTSIASDGHN